MRNEAFRFSPFLFMLKLKDETYGKENSIKSPTPKGKALRIWPLQERFELHASFTTLCRHNKEFTLVPVELPQPIAW